LDEYTPSTRVYEILDYGEGDFTACHARNCSNAVTKDLFDSKSNLVNYDTQFKNANRSSISSKQRSGQPFDQAILDSLGKPSLDQINKFLANSSRNSKNQGNKINVKKINPSVESTLKFQNSFNPTASKYSKFTHILAYFRVLLKTCFHTFKGRVLIESPGYSKYIDGK
jgi:hypothetical protein